MHEHSHAHIALDGPPGESETQSVQLDQTAHEHSHDLREAPISNRVTLAVGAAILIIVVTCLSLLPGLWPGESKLHSFQGWNTTSEEAQIAKVSADGKWVQVFVDDQSHMLPVGSSWTRVHPPEMGDRVHVQKIDRGSGHPEYSLIDRDRSTPLLMVGLMALIALGLVAGFKGIRAFVSTLLVVGLVVFFLLPSIASGNSPVLVALVGGVLTLLVVVYVTHGVTRASSAALLGTLVSMILCLGISWVLVDMLKITGRDIDSDITGLIMGLDIKGLLLAGFVFGSIGVLNDVTIAQSSTVFEMMREGASPRSAFFRAMNVGKDHISSSTYTLVFAYVGASMPLILMMLMSHYSGRAILSTELLSAEIVRSVVGVLALCLCLPVTTGLAVLLARSGGLRKAE